VRKGSRLWPLPRWLGRFALPLVRRPLRARANPNPNPNPNPNLDPNLDPNPNPNPNPNLSPSPNPSPNPNPDPEQVRHRKGRRAIFCFFGVAMLPVLGGRAPSRAATLTLTLTLGANLHPDPNPRC